MIAIGRFAEMREKVVWQQGFISEAFARQGGRAWIETCYFDLVADVWDVRPSVMTGVDGNDLLEILRQLETGSPVSDDGRGLKRIKCIDGVHRT